MIKTAKMIVWSMLDFEEIIKVIPTYMNGPYTVRTDHLGNGHIIVIESNFTSGIQGEFMSLVFKMGVEKIEWS